MTITYDHPNVRFDDTYVSFDGLLIGGADGEVAVSEAVRDALTVVDAPVGGLEIDHDA